MKSVMYRFELLILILVSVPAHSGEAWNIYTTGNSGLPCNFVVAAAPGRNGDVWFVTPRALTRFDGRRWRTHDIPPGTGGNRIFTSIAVGGDDAIWLADSEGLVRFHGSGWERVDLPAAYRPRTDTGASVAVDAKGTVWYGNIRGIYKYERNEWTPCNGHGAAGIRPVRGITAVNGVLFAYGAGLRVYDGSVWREIPTPAGSPINAVAVDGNDVVWFGLRKGGLGCFDGSERTGRSIGGSTDNEVFAVAVDGDDAVWLATEHGISRFDGFSWNTYTTGDGLPHDYVLWAVTDKNGNVWFGTAGGVACRTACPTVTAEPERIPGPPAIRGNHPNPFNTFTTITFTLPAPGHVSLVIYNVTGQKVRELLSKKMTAGTHAISWDGRDDSGLTVSSGSYIARLTMGDRSAARTMTFVK